MGLRAEKGSGHSLCLFLVAVDPGVLFLSPIKRLWVVQQLPYAPEFNTAPSFPSLGTLNVCQEEKKAVGEES